MSALTGNFIQNTYGALLQTGNGTGLTSSLLTIQDGKGNSSILGLSTTAVSINSFTVTVTGTTTLTGSNTGDQTITLTGDVTGTGTGSFATTIGSINGTSIGTPTGTGNLVWSNSPTLVTPALGIPSSVVLTNATGTASGLTAGHVTTNANLTGVITSVGNATSIASQTGTGTKFVVDTSPTLVTPLLGTPTSGTLTNCTGYTVSNLSGLGTGVGTFLGTPSSANLLSAMTTSTGSGNLVFATSPTFITPILGTPTSGALTNCTSIPVNQATGTLATGHGGTGVTSVTTAPTASSFAGWDANSNLSANSLIEGYTTTATAAGTTTLTVASTYLQYFTGSTTQTVLLPVTSTLVLGQQFLIENRSSGVVTVQSSGGNTVTAMSASSETLYTCILTSGTTAASWDARSVVNNAGGGTVTSVATAGLATGGTITTTGTITVTAATLGDQQTGTSTTTVVTPGRQHYNPSATQAWAYIVTGVGPSLSQSYNCSGVVRNGTGDYTVSYTTAFSGGQAVNCTAMNGGATAYTMVVSTVATGSARLLMYTVGAVPALTDAPPEIGFSAYGALSA